VRNLFYDQHGDQWECLLEGRMLRRVKRNERRPELVRVPDLPGFWLHVDGHLYTSWEGRGSRRQKQRVNSLERVEPTDDGMVDLYHNVRLDELMLETFVGPRPDDHFAFHLDGDEDNCALVNLAWRMESYAIGGRTKLEQIEFLRSELARLQDESEEAEPDA